MMMNNISYIAIGTASCVYSLVNHNQHGIGRRFQILSESKPRATFVSALDFVGYTGSWAHRHTGVLKLWVQTSQI